MIGGNYMENILRFSKNSMSEKPIYCLFDKIINRE